MTALWFGHLDADDRVAVKAGDDFPAEVIRLALILTGVGLLLGLARLTTRRTPVLPR